MATTVPETVRADVEELARRRNRFVWPLLAAALTSYALTLLAFAYWPSLVRQQVVGSINVAYVLAAAQFVMTLGVGIAYARWAGRVLDPAAERIRAALVRHDADPDRTPAETVRETGPVAPVGAAEEV